MTVQPTDALGFALEGLNKARTRMAEDAQTIAEDPWDIDAIVDLQLQKHAFAANAVVLRTIDETHRTLLDALA